MVKAYLAKTLRYFRTDPALEDLKEIFTYTSGDNPDAARRVGMDIYETVTLPASNGKIREIVRWSYRIFNRVDRKKKTVEILTIWHGARRTPIVRKPG